MRQQRKVGMFMFASLVSASSCGGFALASEAPAHRPDLLAQRPEVCTEIYQPVCGTDSNGKRVTYPNACFARMAKATNVTPGECPK